VRSSNAGCNIDKKELLPIQFLSSSLPRTRSCAHVAVVEKREKRGKSMKSITSHEKSKQRRDGKETRRRKFSKAEKRMKGRNTRARERDRGRVRHAAGIRVHTSRLHALTHGSIPRHTEHARESRSL